MFSDRWSKHNDYFADFYMRGYWKEGITTYTPFSHVRLRFHSGNYSHLREIKQYYMKRQ